MGTAPGAVPHPFIKRYPADVTGVLHGWDRLRVQGTLRTLYYGPVMERYLSKAGVLWKDYKRYLTGITQRVCQAAKAWAEREHRPMTYLPSVKTDKEQEARRAQRQRPVRQGLVAVLSCVEPCRTWFARGNRQTRQLELKVQWGKCLHLYYYYIHAELGWLSVRLQTWFPFLIQICLNGREWLARQSEYACNVTFRSRAALRRIYPTLVRHTVTNLSCEQVLQYMRGPSRARKSDVVHGDLRRGPDGLRLKHWVNRNSLKAYDKESNLRGELTMNDPRDFKVWRAAENQPKGKRQWRILRRGLADLYRRAQVSRAGVDRYLAALAAVADSTPLAQEAAAVCCPTRRQGRRCRALNPFGEADAQLLLAVNRGEFAANGLRNRDLRALLYPSARNALNAFCLL